MSASDPVDAYLDSLLVELRGRAGDVRRVLAEAEEHLRDATDEGVARGLALEDAQREAVERFGPAAVVARRFAAETPFRLPRAVFGQLVLVAMLFTGIGLTAVGLSGAVAAGMGAAWGHAFVSGDRPDVTYTPARCAQYQVLAPRPTCREAATAHHFGEVVDYRLAAGLAGLMALGAYAIARRRRHAADFGVLPEGFVPTVGATVFGIAAAGLLVQGLGSLMIGGASGGAGQWLSGGLVAAAVSGSFVKDVAKVLALRT